MHIYLTPTRCAACLATLCLCLSLGACRSLTRGSPIPKPPPLPTAGTTEAPGGRTPLLASTWNAGPKRGDESELRNFFEHWRAAWMTRDFDGYMTHYAPAYSGNGTPALRWQTRRLRMVQGKSDQAELRFGPLSIEIADDDSALVSFAQYFEDGDLSEIGTKQWQLRRIDGRWRIEQEVFERRAP